MVIPWGGRAVQRLDQALKQGREAAIVGTVQGMCAGVQGYLTHKKTVPPRNLLSAYAWGPTVVLGGETVSYERGSLVPE